VAHCLKYAGFDILNTKINFKKIFSYYFFMFLFFNLMLKKLFLDRIFF